MNMHYAYVDQPLSVPCGRCIGCRLEKSRQWAMRIMHESDSYDKNIFATLTYNNDNLPANLSLNKRHLQLFFKKLRNYLTNRDKCHKIRYYACGEYGDRYQRPHYHVIIFNYWPHDTELNNPLKPDSLFKSETLTQLWEKGNTIFGSLTFESASYTASYCTKKVLGDEADKHYNGRQPEFALMSRRPGIGSGWMDENKNRMWENDTVIMRGKEMRPPAFYFKKLKEQDDELHAKIKSKRMQEYDPAEHEFIRLKSKIQVAEAKQKLYAKNKF